MTASACEPKIGERNGPSLIASAQSIGESSGQDLMHGHKGGSMHRLAAYLSTILLAAIGTSAAISSTRSVAAVNYNPDFKWAVNSFYYEEVSTANADQWATSVQAGAWDWYYNSDLEVHVTSSSGFWEIYAVAQYNIYYPHGWATAYSNNYTCISYPSGLSGYCDTSTEMATTGVIDLNDVYYSGTPSQNQLVAAHELGHLFGLAHCCC